MSLYVSVNVARQLEEAGRPWHIRLENRTTRNAFWEAWGAGGGEAFINWGKIGTTGRTTHPRKMVVDAFAKTCTQLTKHYEYDINTRMDIKSLTKKLTGPFAKISRVRIDGGSCVAFDHAGNQLMRLPKSTVKRMHSETNGGFLLEVLK